MLPPGSVREAPSIYGLVTRHRPPPGRYAVARTALLSTVPVEVLGATSAKAITAGGFDSSRSQSCLLTTAGAVKCWGNNLYGQLGVATSEVSLGEPCSTVPVDVVGLGDTATAIAAGSFHSCAVLTNGAIRCWGYNALGPLGDGTTTTSTAPVDVVGLASDAVAVSAGKHHTCALMDTGGVQCGGHNGTGQLGDGLGGPRVTSARYL